MARTTADALIPQVIRLEIMPLDCGDGAAVIELDRTPGRAWYKAFKRVLSESDGLESVQARGDGRFVYVVGIEPGRRGAHNRLMQALRGADQRCTLRQTAPAPTSARPVPTDAMAALAGAAPPAPGLAATAV